MPNNCGTVNGQQVCTNGSAITYIPAGVTSGLDQLKTDVSIVGGYVLLLLFMIVLYRWIRMSLDSEYALDQKLKSIDPKRYEREGRSMKYQDALNDAARKHDEKKHRDACEWHDEDWS